MVILFISDNLCIGGKERQIVELLTFFAKDSQNQYVLLLQDNKVDFALIDFPNLKIIKPLKRLSFLQFISFQKKVIRTIRPDLVHTWEGMVTLSAIIVRLISNLNYKIINGSIRYAKRYHIFSKTNIVNKINAYMSDLTVANSNAGLLAAGYNNSAKFHVVPNGFDMNRFDKFHETKRKRQVLQIAMVANFSSAKDYGSLVRASVSLFESGHEFQVFLVGDGSERKSVECSIPDKYKKRFAFTGCIPSKEVFPLLNKIDIGVLLSKKGNSEGMSNTIMEYMIFGIPVVCTDTGGNPELIIDDYNGFLIPHEDVSALIDRLTILIKDYKKRQIMGDESRKIAYTRFKIANVAKKYLELYKFD